jgi:hypothetical protein
MSVKFCTAAAVAALSVFLGPASFAMRDVDSEGALTISASGIVSYPENYFENFTPATALDMVQRVPGFSLSDGDTERRGLGDSFGNVLINGSRPSNKSLSLQTVLQRISVDDVIRVDLIQEAMPQYDLRGHSRLVNVILREGAGNSGSYDLQLMHFRSGRIGTTINTSYTTIQGPVELTFGLEANVHGNRMTRDWIRYDAAGLTRETQHDEDQRRQFWGNVSLAMNWTIDDASSLRLNGQVNPWSWHRNNTGRVNAPSGGGYTPSRIEQNSTENHGQNFDLSGSYQRQLSDNLSMETIGLLSLNRGDDGPEAYEVYDVVTGFTGATIVKFSEQREETALRQTFSWTPGAQHQLEFGAETAVNSRETSLGLSYDDGVIVTPIALPVANTTVEETRSELFATHVWSISDALTLESGLRYEMSEIIQTGDAEQTRSFSYAKPSATLSWRLDEQNRLRITGRRDVDQLQFDRFASSVSVTDNQSTLGNPDYVPQQSWTLEAEWERRFGDSGSVSFLLGHDWVQELDGRLPVTTQTGTFDTFGNIGDGYRTRANFNISTALDAIGLSNAVIDANLAWTDTRVEDPLTGLDRSFFGANEWRLDLDYRQTFPQSQLAWGWDYHMQSDSEMYFASQYHLHEQDPGDLDVYIETTRWFGATTRFGINEALAQGNDRHRIFYDGSRADDVVSGSEDRNMSRGTTAFVQVRGTF